MGDAAAGAHAGPGGLRRDGEKAPVGRDFGKSGRAQGGGEPGSARSGERSAAARLARPQTMGGHRDRPRIAGGSGAGGRQRNEKHVLEEPEGRSSVHEYAGAEQHSAAGERVAGQAQAPAILAGVDQRIYLRNDGSLGLNVLLLFRPKVGKGKMSRVHDALRRAELGTPEPEQAAPEGQAPAPAVSEVISVNGGGSQFNGR